MIKPTMPFVYCYQGLMVISSEYSQPCLQAGLGSVCSPLPDRSSNAFLHGIGCLRIQQHGREMPIPTGKGKGTHAVLYKHSLMSSLKDLTLFQYVCEPLGKGTL